MNCRCWDIKNCTNDIRILQDVLGAMGRICRLYEEVASDEKKMLHLERQAYCLRAEDRGALESKVNTDISNIQSSINSARSYYSAELSRLSSELPRLKQEDRDYHDYMASKVVGTSWRTYK